MNRLRSLVLIVLVAVVLVADALFLGARVVRAQTVTVTAKASWAQPGNTLAEAQSFVYKVADGATITPITNVTCVSAGTPAVVTCSGTIPMPSAGPHSFIAIASSPDGSLQAAGVALVGTMPGSPSKPTVTVTVTIS